MRPNKSIGPDGISIDLLKLGGSAVTGYILHLFNVTMNNNTLPNDWKKANIKPIFKGGDKKIVENYRPVSLTSVVCKLVEKIIAEYLRD